MPNISLRSIRILRASSVILVLAITILFNIVPVWAIVGQPDTISINGVWVYRNCRETGDQIYLVDYTVDYTINPVDSITTNYFLRLLDSSGNELGVTSPYAYYDAGYDRGVVALYFSASDAPAWEGDYVIQIVGNPTITWDGDVPDAQASSFNLWQDYPTSAAQIALASRILYLADILEQTWAVDMIQSTPLGSSLTTYGEDYFVNVIPNLSLMAPAVFSGQMIAPDVSRDEFEQEYAEDLASEIIGTPLDISELATTFGMSREALTTILYYSAVAILVGLTVHYLQSYKPALMIAIPAVIGGAFVGVPLVVTIVIGFVALVMIAYALFYRPSTA